MMKWMIAVLLLVGFGACSKADQSVTTATDNDTQLTVEEKQDQPAPVSRTGAQERADEQRRVREREREQKTAGSPDTPLEEIWETIKDPDHDGDTGGEVRSDDIKNSTEHP